MNVKEQNTQILKTLLLCLLIACSGKLTAQALVCGSVSVALSTDNCTATIMPADIVENQGDFPGFPANFSVELFFDTAMTMPVPTSPVLTSAELGLMIIAQVIYDPPVGAGNNCWVTIGPVSDYAIPDLDCPATATTVSCTDDLQPSTAMGAVLGFPVGPTVTVIDNGNNTYTLQNFDPCGDASLTFMDDEILGACPGGPVKTITRTWTVTDESNNMTSCQEIIIVERITNGALIVFPPDVNLECDASNQPSTDPANTGFPTINGVDIGNLPNSCELQSLPTDIVIDQCGNTSITNRQWQVFDCMGNEIAQGNQVIKIMDNIAPMITCPADITVSTGQNICIASANLAAATTSDACSAVTTSTSASNGVIIGNIITNLPLGNTTVTITATDACDNESDCTYTITAEDQVPPTPICETAHTVSLTNADPTAVPAFVFDDGSYDACSDVSFLVSRMEGTQCTFTDATNFDNFVPFYCCDIGETIMVTLQVMDAAGNTNSCMVEVTVQDKIDPLITCPENKVLDCHQDHTDLSVTGQATAIDNCATIVPTFNDSGSLNSCGVGTIIRTWTADDGNGNISNCIQTITVENQSPFFININNDNDPTDDVIWPADISSSGCTLPASTGEPTILNEDLCSQVGFLEPDDFTMIIANGCIRILRTWTVFDHCQTSVNGGCGNATLDAANIACWTYTQTIDVISTDAPVITACDAPADFCSFDPNCATGTATLTVTAEDDCNELNFNYEIDLDYLNNPGIDIPWTADPGNDGSLTDNFPLGTHLIRWKVEDFCGNFSMCEYPFTIRDCKAPTPIVLTSIARNLMAGLCMIEVDPREWDNAGSPSFDNCGPIAEWRIISPSQNNNGSTPPLGATATWTFTDAGIHSVDLWLRDVNGNWTFESVNISVQDNNVPPCSSPPGYAQVSGAIQNEEGEEVEHVMVEITGDMEESEETGDDGTYQFDLPIENNYTINPERSDDPLNGVSTYDILKISQHILELDLLDSPYKMIAADINRSGEITTLDVVALRRLILYIDTTFQNNTSWRFVDANFVFPNPDDPFASSFPETYSINNLSENMQAHFIGIKTGDVNCSAAANDLTGNNTDRTQGEDFNFIIKNQTLKAGNTYEIEFMMAEVEDFLGYQFTLEFDPEVLAFEHIVPGELEGIQQNNFGLAQADQGIITSSWNTIKGMNPSRDKAFGIRFRALKNTTLNSVITINSKYTAAEAYIGNNISEVSLLIESEQNPLTSIFQLYQNRPNPFKEETLISFYLPEANEGRLTIYNLAGQIVKSINGDFSAGYNELSINRSAFKGNGVFYYRLEVADHIATKRMILLE